VSEQGTPISFVSDGLTYAGLEWGDPEGQLVLALHGWLDNALSFSVLAPHLDNVRLIALDLSGQGFSDHRSADATYHIWDDVPQLVGIVNQLGVSQVAVMGHSRGAAIATLLASALGGRCSDLILLDGALPVPVSEASAAMQLRQSLLDHARLNQYTARLFNDDEAFIAARAKLGFSAASARVLAPRALRSKDDGFELLHDPRLNHASAVKLTQGMCDAFYSALAAQTLAIVAESGSQTRGSLKPGIAALERLANAIVRVVPGGHHTHMEEGAQSVAEHINRFLCNGPTDG
jgi:pimeloyl-ACP methyl ester carboxylesterase